MKIAFLIHRLEGGGAERQLCLLAAQLHLKGHAVEVISFYPGGHYRHILEEHGVPFRDLGKRSRWDLIGPLFRLIRSQRKTRPDFLHGYLSTGNLLMSLCAGFVPGAKVVWGIRGSHMDLGRYPWIDRVLFHLENRLRNSPRLVITNSTAGRKDLVVRGFDPNRIEVIPNGIDVSAFQRDESSREVLRQHWGLGPSDQLLGVIGRLDPMKDHPTFLEALALLQQRGRRFQALCLGSGSEPYSQQLKALACRLQIGDRLRWEPNRTDLPGVYSALDLLCLPSSMGEGFSNVLGEALACGTPCVATRVGDAHLLLPDARLVEPGNPEALASAMEQALDSDPTQEATRGIRLIHEAYTPQALADRTETALTRVLMS